MADYPKTQFEAVTPSSWVEFFTGVIAVAKMKGVHPDQVVDSMYTVEVKKKLGDMPVPPWYLQETGRG